MAKGAAKRKPNTSVPAKKTGGIAKKMAASKQASAYNKGMKKGATNIRGFKNGRGTS